MSAETRRPLAGETFDGQAFAMEEPRGIYRGEVLAMMGALADIYAGTSRILELLGDDEEDDDEAEEVDS